jgi:hypothetical protein
MNNCYSSYAQENAATLIELLTSEEGDLAGY